MAKTLLLNAVSGVIVAGADDNSFAVTDLAEPKTLRSQGMQDHDVLNVVVKNYAGDGWVPFTDGNGQVQLSRARRSVTPMEIGEFAVEGSVAGPATIYTEDAS